jgi:hypothetical protein
VMRWLLVSYLVIEVDEGVIWWWDVYGEWFGDKMFMTERFIDEILLSECFGERDDYEWFGDEMYMREWFGHETLMSKWFGDEIIMR